MLVTKAAGRALRGDSIHRILFYVACLKLALIQHANEIFKQHSSWCNTEGQRHHERTCIDMDVVVVQAAFPHIFDRQVTRKGLILDIGVCIMEEK